MPRQKLEYNFRVRTIVTALAIAVLAGVVQAQASSDEVTRIQLTIKSPTLPKADRKEVARVVHQYRYQGTQELAERLRDELQVLGYFRASVGNPELSFISDRRGGRIAAVRIKVDEGKRYYLGEIRFRGATVFATAVLRETFPIQPGEVFNVEKIRQGISNLGSLYRAQGYVMFTPVPSIEIDSEHLRADIVFDLGEGKQFYFGPLVLDGPEPHAGAGRALLDSWVPLKGQVYSWATLEQWFSENRANLPKSLQVGQVVETFPDLKSQLITVRLSLPVRESLKAAAR